MATNKKSTIEDIKGGASISPLLMGLLTVFAAAIGLIEHFKQGFDKGFTKPYTHMHYVDTNGEYICGDMYINNAHICDGRFLNVKAEKPELDDFIKLGLTKEQYDKTQKTLKQDRQ